MTSAQNPHGDTLAPIDQVIADLGARCHHAQLITLDEALNLIIDARIDTARNLDKLEATWRSAATYLNPEARQS